MELQKDLLLLVKLHLHLLRIHFFHILVLETEYITTLRMYMITKDEQENLK